jgi:hypothetical protein
MKTNVIENLRRDIMESLKSVTEVNAPKIHQRIQTKVGYSWIENEIISMVLSTGQAPAMCIPQLESEL